MSRTGSQSARAQGRPTARVVRPGVVSVVLVNYKGADDTIAAAQSLRRLAWPADRLEIVVVDNDSRDGGADLIEAELPDVRLVRAGSNTGFAGGCNLGIAASQGEYVAFLNNDARADEGWVAAAVEAFESDPDVSAVASKVLDWEGRVVDYVDGSLTWFGMGYKREADEPDNGRWDTPKDVLFGTGAAMFVRSDVFTEVGGFDERFFMFYEDVDLGWRLNLLGHRFRYVPTSIAYHRHHATMGRYGSYRETYLLERNALLSMYKNLDDESLARALPAAMALSVRRSMARSGTDTTVLDLQRHPEGEAERTLIVDKMALTGPMAIDYFVSMLPGLQDDRLDLQRRRRRTDPELFELFRQPIEPAYPDPDYVAGHDALVAAFGIAQRFVSRLKILVVTGEPLTDRLAGPAIRAWQIASALADRHDVRLLSLLGSDAHDPRFDVRHASGHALRSETDWADVIIFQGFLLDAAPWLVRSRKILVADVYDPIHLEQLEQARDLGAGGREIAVRDVTRVLNEQLRRADFVLCASAKQRDFWLGQLAALGRVNPTVYDEDHTLSNLVAVVPFGLPDEPPVQRRHAIKGTVAGIGPDDKVVLWGGGIYNWFDPLTLVRAMGVLHDAHPEVRLYFLGVAHPNPHVPQMRMAADARALADELGLTDRVVFFNEGWVPYAERADYLMDADVGVSTHLTHLETAFSFRTRILDYVWAGLPVVCTQGDAFGELVAERGLGRAVPARDVDALVTALETMLFDEGEAAASRRAVAGAAPHLAWSRALRPLVDFCAAPRRAADLADDLGTPDITATVTRAPWRGVGGDLRLLKEYLAAGGPGEVVRRASGRVRRVVSGR